MARIDLAEFIKNRLRGFEGTGKAKLENIGWAAASWLLQEGTSPGTPIPAKLVRILKPTAERVIDRAISGVTFLEALRDAIHYDDDLLTFLRFVEDWTNSTSTDVIELPKDEPASLAPGDSIGGFDIIEPIAKGGMGLVFKAVQRSLDRPVALKVLTKELAQNGSFVERFHLEARAAAKLRHPNIVQVIEAGMCEKTGIQFIAFEFIEGQTVSEFLRQKGKLLESEALPIVLSVARALTCAEEAGIVHRDIKPGNILLGKDWIPKLGDLGLAKHIDEATRRTAVGLVIGTPHYMAPEQALSVDKLDIRVDLYALGITLFELVTGELPFQSQTAMGVIAQHVNSDLPDAREFDPEVSEETALLITHLAARARLRRYSTAKEAADNIQRVIDGELPRPPGLSPAKKSESGREAPRARPIDPKPKPKPKPKPEPEPEPEPEVSPWEKLQQRSSEQAKPTSSRARRGRGFYDDDSLHVKAPSDHQESTPSGLKRKMTSGFYGDGELLKPSEHRIPEPVAEEAKTTEELPSLPAAEGVAEELRGPPAAEEAETPKVAPIARRVADGPSVELLLSSGSGFYSDRLLRERLEIGLGSPKSRSDDSAPTMVLSEDMMRAFQLGARIGGDPTSRIYDADVVGDQEFKGFRNPVTKATVRFGRDHDLLASAQDLHSKADRRIVQLLDSGVFNDLTYLALEKLELHPYEHFGGQPVTPGVALDTFINLLTSAKGLHFRRSNPLVLCDIKPDTIMVRAWSEGGLDDDAYTKRLAEGAYQPVFADISGAQKRGALRKSDGRPTKVIGSPIYLAPESMPEFDGDALRPGIYSAKTDVFSLALVLYVHLTGDKPYNYTGVYEFSGAEFLGSLMALKADGAHPADWDRLHGIVGEGSERLEELLRSALDPDPEKRATANALLDLCKRRFAVEVKPAPTSPYTFDDEAHGIRLRQGFFGQ